MMRVLITRPHGDAERTARQLALRGHEAIIAPIMRIERTSEPPPAGPFDAMILTSTNSVAALASLRRDAKTLPVFVVGERTGSAVKEAGFHKVYIAGGDAASLAELVARTVSRGAKLLLIAGHDRKPEPEASLTKAGFEIALWTVYRAFPAEHFPETARHALSGRRLDAALHYSRRSASLALDLADKAGLGAELCALTHVCLSADAAASLQAAGARFVVIAARPDENALLVALDEGADKFGSAGSRATQSG
jgi:uroporphyrinogen-III synthase